MFPWKNCGYNKAFAVKKWGWRCEQCWRIVEEIKPIDGVEYK